MTVTVLLPAHQTVACSSDVALFQEGWRDPSVRRHLAATCAVCPALASCTSFSLSQPVDGFVAGMTPHQRRQALVRQRKALEAVA